MPLTRWVDSERLFYENVQTGVYCAFDYSEPASDSIATETASGTALSFNSNCARPHFFGLETMPLAVRVCADLGYWYLTPRRRTSRGRRS